jgi:hypothetical protein
MRMATCVCRRVVGAVGSWCVALVGMGAGDLGGVRWLGVELGGSVLLGLLFGRMLRRRSLRHWDLGVEVVVVLVL